MEVIGVIPARLKSSRMEKKLLRKLQGKAVLEWTWKAASRAKRLEDLIIACDSKEIEDEAKGFGAKTVFTSPDHPSGTDRISEAVNDIDTRVVVNIQADEPLISSSVIDSLADVMREDKGLSVSTAVKVIDDEDEIEDPNIVKVVIDKKEFALYFSRAKIPFLRDKGYNAVYYKHLGIYAYTKDFLYIFKNLPPSSLEKAEKLEQLRILEAGFKIKAVTTPFDSWGIDTESDLTKVEKILTEKGYA